MKGQGALKLNEVTGYFDVLWALVVGAVGSLVCCLALLLASTRFHGMRPQAHAGPQQIHEKETIRVGGAAVVVGVLLLFVFMWPGSQHFAVTLLCIAPIFLIGVSEDVTNSVSALARLIISIASATSLVIFDETVISLTGFVAFDLLLTMPALAAILSIVSITTMCHAINIIDGLNGLASGTCIIILSSIAILAGMAGDSDIKLVALVVLAPTLGFFLLNFPRGLIFLGDGGAYFLGMTVAFVAINLPTRNPEISSFASLLIVSYPIYETMRSYVRRFKKRGQALMQPDNLHLHSRFFRFLDDRLSLPSYIKNSIASFVVMGLPAFGCTIAVLFYGNVEILVLGLFLQIAAYELLMHLVEKRI